MDDNSQLPEIHQHGENREEAEAASEVLNALAYYKKYGLLKLSAQGKAFARLPAQHREMIASTYAPALRTAKSCVMENQKFFDAVLESGKSMLDRAADAEFLDKAYAITQLRPATEHYMAKVRSTLKQLARDWSEEGRAERDSCYSRILKALYDRYPNVEKRADVTILVPGSGLARLVWQLVQDGFSTIGNECSMLMLLVSNFILNCSDQANQYTIYPYASENNNQWSYENQFRGIQIPDVCPTKQSNNTQRRNTFSMCAGDFVSAMDEESDESFDCVVTCFFLDTATNPFIYVDVIKRILKSGGVWVNFGPLLYHYAGEGADSIELPYEQVMHIVKASGFEVVKDERMIDAPAKYVSDQKSMLQYSYHCGFFECVKV